MPVQRSMIFAISSSVTLSRSRFELLRLFCVCFSSCFELLFELGQIAVLELRGLFVFAALFGELNVAVELFDLLAQLLHLPDGLLLVFPLRLHGR